MAFTNISHGSSNWEKDVNNNFAQLHQDTGWQNFDFVAPSSGTLQYKILNDILFFMGTVKVGAVGNVTVGTFPANIASRNFVVKGNAVNNTISFDGVALYVGN